MRLLKQTALRVESLEDRCLMSGDVVVHWNEMLLQSLATHSGPIPLARNMAIVHIAMFDAANAIDQSYQNYAANVLASRGASQEAAVAQAAHDTLVALYPARAAIFEAALASDLAGIAPGLANQGIAVGQQVAQQILELRSNDGAASPLPYTPPNTDPGEWQTTGANAGGVHISAITPFALDESAQFRPGPPPELNSTEYTTAFNEVKALGAAIGSTRTPDQTLVAGLWQSPLTNHQVWNRIAQDMVEQQDTSVIESARLFARLDMALNDSLQGTFESKYHYTLWRPVTAIRALEDGNPNTESDPNWASLHTSTPPYPAYAGGVATVGAACATVLADAFGSSTSFQIPWSDYGFAGVTRSYTSFWQAAEEAAWSRIYGGIHFSFDNVAGQGIGVNVANYVLENFLQPRTYGQSGVSAGGAVGLATRAPGALGQFAGGIASSPSIGTNEQSQATLYTPARHDPDAEMAAPAVAGARPSATQGASAVWFAEDDVAGIDADLDMPWFGSRA
jgi:hypothetical protein